MTDNTRMSLGRKLDRSLVTVGPWLLGAVIVLMLGQALFVKFMLAPPKPPPGPAPAVARSSISEDKVNVLGVRVDKDTLFVDMTPDTTLDDPRLLGSIGYKAAEIGKDFQKGVSEDKGQLRTVTFLIVAPATDRLGNVSASLLMNISYSVDDLRRARIDNLGPEQFLDLASHVFVGSAVDRKLIRAHCSLPDNIRDAPNFCALVARPRPKS